MKTGGWGSLLLIYLYGVASAASLSKAIPLQGHIAVLPGAGSGSFSLFMSLMAVPPAVLGALSGGFIDRIGARPALIAASVCGALLNAAYAIAGPMKAFLGLRILEGAIPLLVYAAAPALMIATAAPARRPGAMALWSTYAPVGTSIGLMMAAGFAAGSHWRAAYMLHGLVFVALALAGLLLPAPASVPAAPQDRSPLKLLATREGIPPLRLALAFGLLILLGLGMSIVFPPFLARRGVGVGTASAILAATNLAMILGGTASGVLLTRGMRPSRLLGLLAVCGTLLGGAVFAPRISVTATVALLAAWSLCTGAAMAVLAAQMPRVAPPSHRAAVAGLISQTGAILTFVTPPLWLAALASGRWDVLALLVAAGWLICAWLLPGGSAAIAGAAPAVEPARKR